MTLNGYCRVVFLNPLITAIILVVGAVISYLTLIVVVCSDSSLNITSATVSSGKASEHSA